MKRINSSRVVLAVAVVLFLLSPPVQGGKWRRISPPDSAFEVDPSRNGDGTKIAWNIIGKGLYIIDIDGTNMRQLCWGGDPAWSPTADKIAYVDGYLYNDTFYTKIKLIDADGTGERTIFETSFSYWDPDSGIWAAGWSPDGSKLIFSLHGNIYTVDTCGTNLTQLTSDQEYENYPCYSPDGTRIVYTKGDNLGPPGATGEAHLWMMNSDGTNQHFFLSKGRGELVFQDGWSPDGRRIVYTVWYPEGVDTLSEVWMVNSDGSGNKRLTDGALYNDDMEPNQDCVWCVDPIWLNDSTLIMAVVPIIWIDPGPPPEFEDDYYNGGIFSLTVPLSGIEGENKKLWNLSPPLLRQSHPNPFNSNTVISYRFSSASDQRLTISLKVYNILGQLVKVLVDEKQAPGDYSVIWDGRDYLGREVPSGVYFYKLEIKNGDVKGIKVKKLLLLR